MKLYFIRHGQSYNNARPNPETPRHADPSLTDIGFQQSQLIAQHLATQPDLFYWKHPVPTENDSYNISHIIVSSMWRAMQTTAPIAAALNLQPHIWDDIHEQGGIYLQEPDGEVTGYSGKKRSEIMQDYPSYHIPNTVTEEGWWKGTMETDAEAHHRAARVSQRLFDLAQILPDASIAFISHQLFFSRLLQALFAMPADNAIYFNHLNTAMARLDFAPDGRVIVRYLNQAPHLPPDLRTA